MRPGVEFRLPRLEFRPLGVDSKLSRRFQGSSLGIPGSSLGVQGSSLGVPGIEFSVKTRVKRSF